MSRIATLTITTAAVMVLAGGALAAGPQSSTQTTPPPAQQTTPPPAQQTPPPQSARPTGQSDMTQWSGRDEDFLKDVAQGAQVEIESSKLAMTKAQNAEVKALAEKLVNDHNKAADELKTLVSSKHAEWTQEDAKFKEKKQKHESLQTLSGAEFDKEYLEDMISDHESTIAMFARYILNAKDASIKSFAQKMEPELRNHLKMARDLRAKLFK